MAKKVIFHSRINEYRGDTSIRQLAKDIGEQFESVRRIADNKATGIPHNVIGKLMLHFGKSLEEMYHTEYIDVADDASPS